MQSSTLYDCMAMVDSDAVVLCTKHISVCDNNRALTFNIVHRSPVTVMFCPSSGAL